MCSASIHVRFTPNSDRESGFPQMVMWSRHGLYSDYWARFQVTSAVPTVGPKGAVNFSPSPVIAKMRF